jgi:trk system potassium uptake protein
MVDKISYKMEQIVFRNSRVRTLTLPILTPKSAGPLSSVLFLTYTFGVLILAGALFLMFPFCSASGEFTSPVDALFTATSAVCVTGLTVLDSGTYWNGLGQGVILVLFQIGGLGFLIGATLLLVAIGGKFGLKERVTLSETMGTDQPGGILSIVIKVTMFTLAIEVIGVILLYLRLTATGYAGSSFWVALFHAVSAYNNCGMDIFGNFRSLSDFQGDSVVLLITSALILFGSTGYVVFVDIFKSRGFIKLTLDSKIIITTTLGLLALGTLFYLAAEYSNPATLEPLSFPRKVLVSFFQSVTARTAGFTVLDAGAFTQISLFFTMFLMLFGGAAGSVSGGVKVNTLGILVITAVNIFRGKENIEAFGRQLNRQMIFRAITLFITYISITLFFTVLMWITESFPLDKLLFEVFSAMGTVGLSTGITPELSSAGRIILVFTMFVGRVGPLVFMAYLAHRRQPCVLEYPYENVRLG